MLALPPPADAILSEINGNAEVGLTVWAAVDSLLR